MDKLLGTDVDVSVMGQSIWLRTATGSDAAGVLLSPERAQAVAVALLNAAGVHQEDLQWSPVLQKFVTSA